MPAVPFQPRAPFLADSPGQDFLHLGNLRLPLRGVFKAVLRAGIAVEREVRAGPINQSTVFTPSVAPSRLQGAGRSVLRHAQQACRRARWDRTQLRLIRDGQE
jgi:hypothetical protein